jgi:hypothetical protein
MLRHAVALAAFIVAVFTAVAAAGWRGPAFGALGLGVGLGLAGAYGGYGYPYGYGYGGYWPRK